MPLLTSLLRLPPAMRAGGAAVQDGRGRQLQQARQPLCQVRRADGPLYSRGMLQPPPFAVLASQAGACSPGCCQHAARCPPSHAAVAHLMPASHPIPPLALSDPVPPPPHPPLCSIWGSPLNVKVAVDVVMLATGLLQQQLAGDSGSAPSTPRSARFPPSLSPSVAYSVNGDAE